MAKELAIYERPEFENVRTVEKDGELWFIARDVAELLEIQNIRQNLDDLDEDEKADVCITYASPRNGIEQRRKVKAVNEGGLYHLIFKSRKPVARQFYKYVRHVIIPNWRKQQAPKELTMEDLCRQYLAECERHRAEFKAAIEAHETTLDKYGAGPTHYATCEVPFLPEIFNLDMPYLHQAIGQELGKITRELDLEVQDRSRGVAGGTQSFRAFPLEAVNEFYYRLKADKHYLRKYRKHGKRRSKRR